MCPERTTNDCLNGPALLGPLQEFVMKHSDLMDDYSRHHMSVRFQ